MRIQGELRDNIEELIACCSCALQILTRDSTPIDYAKAQMILGFAYLDRIEGERDTNLKASMICFRHSLEIYTCDSFPNAHRNIQLGCASINIEQQNWEDAHASCESAFAAEEMLIALGTGMSGLDAVFRRIKSATTYDAFALAHLSRIPEAATVSRRAEHDF